MEQCLVCKQSSIVPSPSVEERPAIRWARETKPGRRCVICSERRATHLEVAIPTPFTRPQWTVITEEDIRLTLYLEGRRFVRSEEARDGHIVVYAVSAE